MLSGEHLLRLPVLTQGSGKKFPSKAEFLTNIFEAPRRALYPSLRAPASRSGWFPPRGSPPPARADPAGNHGGGDSTETGRAAARRPREILLPQGAASTGDAPPIVVVAKSAQLRFRLRRKLRPLPCASSPHRAGRGGGPFRSCPKRERAAPGVREKALLATTLHVRAKLLYGSRRERVPAGLRWLPDGRGGVRCRLDSGFPRRGCALGRGARRDLTSSSFPVSRCGAPRISVTSVPLVPLSARSASLRATLAVAEAPDLP